MFLRSLRTALKARHKRAMFRLMLDARSFLRLHFLDAAVQSGLAAALLAPATREELATRLGAARPELLDALLDVGLALGELGKDEERYLVRGRALRALQAEDGDGLAALAEAFVTYYNSIYLGLPERMAGGPLGDYLDWIGPVVARFSRMAEPYVAGFLADAARSRPGLRVLDVGCGSGIYLRMAAEANPEAVGLGLDRDPAVAEQARANLAAWDLAGRFTVQAGDLRDSGLDQSPGFGLIVFANLAYYFPPTERETVYGRLAGLLAPGGRLALVCHFAGQGRDLFAANLNAATCSMRGCWPLPDLAETRAQLASAGLPQQKVERLMPGSSLYGILAGPAA
jgi:SAM-dependent methyltransferase